MSRSHILKTWPGPFDAVVEGRKRFEFRRDDRGFEVGDVLHLIYWDPTPDHEGIPMGYRSGRYTSVVVTYLTHGFGVPPGFVCLSIDGLSKPQPAPFLPELPGITGAFRWQFVEARR